MLTRDKDAGCRIYPASAAAAELLDGSRELVDGIRSCERTQSVRTNPKRANEPKACERTQTVRTNPKRANEPKARERTQTVRTNPNRANEPKACERTQSVRTNPKRANEAKARERTQRKGRMGIEHDPLSILAE